MNYWNHIVIEGICFAEGNPCGQHHPTPFCLLNGHCPHFAYTDSNEREASHWVPLRLILKDKLMSCLDNVWNKIAWYIWHQWSFNRKKIDAFFNNIQVAECPVWDKSQQKALDKFPAWFKKAKKGE